MALVAAGRGGATFLRRELGQVRSAGWLRKKSSTTSAATVSDSSEATPARNDDHDNLLN